MTPLQFRFSFAPYGFAAMRRARTYGLAAAGLMLGLSACASYQAAQLKPEVLVAPSVAAPLPADPDALVKIAIDHDPAVAAARASLDAALAARKAAKNLPPLSLTLTAEYSKDADTSRPWLYGGAAGIPVDIGARRSTRITAADLNVVKARYALADAVWSSRQRLRQGLSDRHFAHALAEADRTLAEQGEAYAAALGKRVAAGEDSRGLAAQAELDASAARQALRQAEAKIVQAEADLARALDATADTVAALPDIAPPAALDAATATTMTEKALVSLPLI